MLFEALLDEMLAVRTPAGRRRPGKVDADKACDHERCRKELRRRGIGVRIARCGVESSERLGLYRWKVERAGEWLFGHRRLRVRYERCDGRFYAFALLACSLICFHVLVQPPW
jgi:hypothetical protein